LHVLPLLYLVQAEAVLRLPSPYALALRRQLLDLGVVDVRVPRAAEPGEVDVRSPDVAVEQEVPVRHLLEVVEVGRGPPRLEHADHPAVERVLLPGAARIEAEVGAEDTRPD